MKEETIEIAGMSCNHCVHAVRDALQRLEGVTVEHVEIGKAVVRYDPETVSQADVNAAIEQEGYTVTASLRS